MSRYIDKDSAIDLSISVLCGGGNEEMAVLVEDINSIPSIEIIRCGECKWFDSGKNDSEIWSMCTRHFGKYIDVNADDFCSYGERNCSEKPNNCEDWQDWKDRMWAEAIVTEPTISKMKQVETMSCAECKHRPIGAEICEEPCHYEPQTDCGWGEPNE